MIADSKGKSGQLEGGQKGGRKPPKIATQGAVAAAPVFCQEGCEEERENRQLDFIIFVCKNRQLIATCA